LTNREKNIELVERQCYEWLSIMNSDCKTPEEVSQFQIWLAADEQHQVVYQQVNSLWAELPILQGEIDPGSYQNIGTTGFWEKLTLAVAFRPVQSAIAGIALLVVLFAGLYRVAPYTLTNDWDDYSTQTAEVKEIELLDTSKVTLGALSAIEVDFSETERRVELLSGEAFFSVEKDESRPFIVSVADAEIRVVGTQFDVRRSQEGVRVSVLEGVVEIIQTHEEIVNGVLTAVQTKRVVTAEEKIRAKPDGELTEIQPVLRERLGAWRKGRLFYENATLSEVISDADRYYSGNIIIDTEDLRDLPVSAAFKTDQIQEMMDTLSVALPVSTKTLSNGDIIIRRRDNTRS
jgi:transmembrane sensor